LLCYVALGYIVCIKQSCFGRYWSLGTVWGEPWSERLPNIPLLSPPIASLLHYTVEMMLLRVLATDVVDLSLGVYCDEPWLALRQVITCL